jgi:hypothetical protein
MLHSADMAGHIRWRKGVLRPLLAKNICKILY